MKTPPSSNTLGNEITVNKLLKVPIILIDNSGNMNTMERYIYVLVIAFIVLNCLKIPTDVVGPSDSVNSPDIAVIDTLYTEFSQFRVYQQGVNTGEWRYIHWWVFGEDFIDLTLYKSISFQITVKTDSIGCYVFNMLRNTEVRRYEVCYCDTVKPHQIMDLSRTIILTDTLISSYDNNPILTDSLNSILFEIDCAESSGVNFYKDLFVTAARKMKRRIKPIPDVRSPSVY